MPSKRGSDKPKFSSEEDVKFKFVVPLLESKGYSQNLMDFNKSIKVHEGRKEKTILADLVVYVDKKRESPVILVETKGPDEILNKAAVEQAISYARLLPRIAPFAVLSNAIQTRVYQVVTKNRIEDLPNREELIKDIVNLVISKTIQDSLRQDAIHELFIIDDVTTFRSILKQCHNEIRNNEGYDPTQAFDEMSKILFCKMYEEKNNAANNRFALKVFDDSMEKLKVNVLQKMYEDTIAHPKYATLFPKGDKIRLQDRTIRKIVELFQNYDLSLTNFDVKGEAFEYFLSDTFTGGLGEYFTPRNVVEFMSEAIDPKIGERIIDPFCGTGGFLIYAFDIVSSKIRLQEFSDEEKEKWQEALSNRLLFGTDWKERTIQACKMNMIVHGDGHTGIHLHNGLTNIDGIVEDNTFDVCLTNPPFGAVENDKETLDNYDLGKGRDSQEREVLAIERMIRLLKPNARGAMVIIEGILNNDKYDYVRDYIRENVWINGIVSVNFETFSGYGSKAATSLILFTKKTPPTKDNGQVALGTPEHSKANKEQKNVFMAVCANTGYSSSGLEIAGNELPEILFWYKKFQENPNAKIADKRVQVVKGNQLQDRLDPQHFISSIDKQRTASADISEAQTRLKEVFAEIRKQYDHIFDPTITDQGSIKNWDDVEITTLVSEYRARRKLVQPRITCWLVLEEKG